MLSQHLSFGEIHTRYAELKDSILTNQRPFSPTSAFLFPSEGLTFSRDFNLMYFTGISKKEDTEKIYCANFSSGEGISGDWKIDTNPLSFCNDQSIYTHPALSEDGNLMIFSSNCSGTLGGMDLFLTRQNGGTWSVPENLGREINTKSNELFPYLDSENNLFFSSDGQWGYGGYDIFVCKYRNGSWTRPVNLSKAVNSEADEIAFTMRKDRMAAFYSVKQKKDNSLSQLYLVGINPSTTTDNTLTLSQLLINPGQENRNETETIHTIAKMGEVPVQAIDTSKITSDQAGKSETIIKSRPQTNADSKKTTENKPVPEALPEVQKSISKPIVRQSAQNNEISNTVIYRVQIISNIKPKGTYMITIGNNSFKTFEYLSGGAYRTCVGEFNILSSAKELQNSLRKSGYPQAFVVAFINNFRSNDPLLFR